MNKFNATFFITLAVFFCSCNTVPDKHKVLIVTGGHDYDTLEFLEVFRSIEGIEFDTLVQPHANQVIAGGGAKQYDVLVFYDMWQQISDAEKQAYRELWEAGKGMVFLHHSLVSYQSWDELAEAVGGRYYLEGSLEDTAKVSGYRHDIDLEVRIIDPDHPVTSGLSDFTTHDEGYSNIEIKPGVTRLLSVEHPDCAPCVGWSGRHRNSRTVYIMLGHDRNAYSSKSFVTLVEQAIRWTAD